MAVPDREYIWEQRLFEQSKSGLNIAAWCNAQGVSRHQFFYWRKRLQSDRPSPSETKGKSETVKWLQMDDTRARDNPCRTDSIAIQIGSARVEVHLGFDPDLLRDVVKVLQSL